MNENRETEVNFREWTKAWAAHWTFLQVMTTIVFDGESRNWIWERHSCLFCDWIVWVSHEWDERQWDETRGKRRKVKSLLVCHAIHRFMPFALCFEYTIHSITLWSCERFEIEKKNRKWRSRRSSSRWIAHPRIFRIFLLSVFSTSPNSLFPWNSTEIFNKLIHVQRKWSYLYAEAAHRGQWKICFESKRKFFCCFSLYRLCRTINTQEKLPLSLTVLSFYHETKIRLLFVSFRHFQADYALDPLNFEMFFWQFSVILVTGTRKSYVRTEVYLHVTWRYGKEITEQMLLFSPAIMNFCSSE